MRFEELLWCDTAGSRFNAVIHDLDFVLISQSGSTDGKVFSDVVRFCWVMTRLTWLCLFDEHMLGEYLYRIKEQSIDWRNELDADKL